MCGLYRSKVDDSPMYSAEYSRTRIGLCVGGRWELSENVVGVENAEKANYEQQVEEWMDAARAYVKAGEVPMFSNGLLNEAIKRVKANGKNEKEQKFWTSSKTPPKGSERRVLCRVTWSSGHNQQWAVSFEPIVGWWKDGPQCFSIEGIENANHLVSHWCEIPEPQNEN